MADPIDSIIDVQISVSDINPAQEGFGVPLILSQHSVGVGGPLVRSYTSLDGIQGDGHDMNGSVYTLAAKMFGQRPRPPRVKVGRRSATWTFVAELVCSVTTTGYVYRFTIKLGLFISQEITYTVTVGQSAADVMTAIAALITAASGTGPFGAGGPFGPYTFGAAYAGGKITFTAGQTGYLYAFGASQEVGGPGGTTAPTGGLPASMTFKDVSLVAGVAADLSAVLTQDRAWYALALDQQSSPAVLAVAPMVEALRKVFVTDTSDSECLNPGSTTDVMAALRAGNYNRTFAMWNPHGSNRAGVALLGGRLTAQPGSDTWFGKNLRGVASYELTDTQAQAVLNKNGNLYLTIAEVGCTQNGTMAGGEFADIVRGVDWLVARIKERIFRLFLNNDKVPFTDAGIATVKQEIDAQLEIASGDSVKLIVPGSYTVTVPKAKDVDAEDKRRRRLTNVVFAGDLQGAIHFVGIRGTLTP